MAKSYPTHWRNNAYANPAPATPKPWERPRGPANDNSPKPANDNLRRTKLTKSFPKGLSRAAGVAGRFLPWLGIAALGYEVWRQAVPNNGAGMLVDADGLLGPGTFGFVLQTQCGVTGWSHYRLLAGNSPFPSTPCFSNSLDSAARGRMEPMNTNGLGRLRLQLHTDSQTFTGSALYSAYQYWYRPTNSPSVLNKQFSRPIPAMPRAEPHKPDKPQPVLDPFLLPIGMPMQLPAPLPWPVAGSLVNTDLPGRDAGNEVPAVPGAVPAHVPGSRTPPPKGTKEKKVKSPRAITAAARVMHGVTEGLDVLEVFHKALPKEHRAKATKKDGRWWNPSPQDKAATIWRNADELDWSAVVEGLIRNEIEDRILGRANAKVDQVLKDAPGGRINRGLAF